MTSNADGARGDEDRWLDIGPLETMPEREPVLRKHGSRRFVCVRHGDSVHALDDRCPHQGFPLSRGSVNDRVLTCEWHNWKFELETGACTFGGEPVRRYPTRVEGGRVHLDVHRDEEAEVQRLAASLRAGLFDVDVARALRDALRIDEARRRSDLHEGLSLLAKDGAMRAPWGFDHGLAVLADLVAWAERGLIRADEAFVVGGQTIAEVNAARPQRTTPDGGDAPMLDAKEAQRRIVDHLVREERADAEIATRFVVRSLGVDAAFAALAPFLGRHLYDYGHAAIFLTKARELARRYPAAAEELLASCAVGFGWATAETSLPPFTATRQALAALPIERKDGERTEFDRGAYETAVLESERTAIAATVTLLSQGVPAALLLRAAGAAAAERLARFDETWAHRVDADTGVLDVTHLVTFVEAALAILSALGSAEDALADRFAVQAAGFIGKLRKSDRQDAADMEESPASGSAADFARAVELRDAELALRLGRGLGADAIEEVFTRVAPFAAFEAACRSIFVAHAVKVTEALWRLSKADPERSGTYLAALGHYLATRWPEGRAQRTAAIARKFIADGKPPEGFY